MAQAARVYNVTAQGNSKSHLGDVYGDVHHHESSVSFVLGRRASSFGTKNRAAILQWLPYIDPSKVHERVREEAMLLNRNEPESEDGQYTGQWLLEHEPFTSWLSQDIRYLWCEGMPGAGKSTLVSIIIEYMLNLRHQLNKTKRPGKLACVYLRHDDPQPLLQILGSILQQLLEDEHCLPKSLVDLYSSCQRKQIAISPTSKQLADILHDLSRVEPIFIVIDALDEAEHVSQTPLIELLKPKKARPGSRVSLLVTSRPCPMSEYLSVGFHVKEITANDLDIQFFLNHVFRRDNKLGILGQDDPVRIEIDAKIKKNCAGMFLLANLQLRQLIHDSPGRSLTVNELREKLRNLPAGTDGIDRLYDAIVRRIQTQESSDSRLAFKVLAWVVLSQRSLTSPELLHVLAWKHGHPDIDPDDQVSLEAIRDVCGGLVVFSQGSVNLVHNTAQSYFRERADDLFVGFHAEIAYVCAGYLSLQVLEVPSPAGRSDYLLSVDSNTDSVSDEQQSDQTTTDLTLTHSQKAVQIAGLESGFQTLQKRSIGEKLRFYPFAHYAAQYLGYHLTRSRECHNQQTDDLIWSILTKSAKRAFFGRVIYHMELFQPFSDIELPAYHHHRSLRPPLEIQASYQATENLAVSGPRSADSELVSSQRDSFDIRIDRFLEYVMEILGFDVDRESNCSEDDEYWDNGSASPSPRMDDFEQHVYDESRSKTTPLHLAAYIGHVASLDRLLEVHDSINADDEFGRTPIVIALQNNHLEFARTCLERGAIVSLASTDGQKILLQMAKGNYDRIIQAIISQNDDLLSALDPGSIYGLGAIVKGLMLLGYLALASMRYISPRINNIFSHADGQNNLMALYRQLTSDNILAAAGRGDLSALKRMSLYNKNVFRLNNEDFRLGMLAAFVAVEYGKVDSVIELLQGGIDVNIKNFEGDTLLHRSACRGNISMVKALVAHHADVRVRDRGGKTPWGAALKPDNQEVLDFLSESGGADPFVTYDNGEPALYSHAAGGNVEFVNFLLKNGVNPSHKTQCDWAPLHWAAHNGHLECVRALINARAELSPISDTRRTPLDMAIGAGHGHIIQILKDCGAQTYEAISGPSPGSRNERYHYDDIDGEYSDDGDSIVSMESICDDEEVMEEMAFFKTVIQRLGHKEAISGDIKKKVLQFFLRDISEVMHSLNGYRPKLTDTASRSWDDICAELQDSEAVIIMLSYEEGQPSGQG